jgi:hypothetical protein
VNGVTRALLAPLPAKRGLIICHRGLRYRAALQKDRTRAVAGIVIALAGSLKVTSGSEMNGFLKATFTRKKFQGLFLNTALGNFAAYLAGSLVTLASTRHALDARAIGNLFGLLPRKKVVVHLLPHWLEWLLALLLGFLVMEAVRHYFNRCKYAAFLSASRPQPRTEQGGQASNRSGEAEQSGSCSETPNLGDRPLHGN